MEELWQKVEMRKGYLMERVDMVWLRWRAQVRILLASETEVQSEAHRFQTSRQPWRHSRQMFCRYLEQPPQLRQQKWASRWQPSEQRVHRVVEASQSMQLSTSWVTSMTVREATRTNKLGETSARQRKSPPPAPSQRTLQPQVRMFYPLLSTSYSVILQCTEQTGFQLLLMKWPHSPSRMKESITMKVGNSRTSFKEIGMKLVSPQRSAGFPQRYSFIATSRDGPCPTSSSHVPSASREMLSSHSTHLLPFSQLLHPMMLLQQQLLQKWVSSEHLMHAPAQNQRQASIWMSWEEAVATRKSRKRRRHRPLFFQFLKIIKALTKVSWEDCLQ